MMMAEYRDLPNDQFALVGLWPSAILTEPLIAPVTRYTRDAPRQPLGHSEREVDSTTFIAGESEVAARDGR